MAAPSTGAMTGCNEEWERLTGGPSSAVEGRLATETVPIVEREWIELFGRVVEFGRPESITWTAESFDSRWFEARAFPLGGMRFGIAFVDVTEKVRWESRRAQLDQEL